MFQFRNRSAETRINRVDPLMADPNWSIAQKAGTSVVKVTQIFRIVLLTFRNFSILKNRMLCQWVVFLVHIFQKTEQFP